MRQRDAHELPSYSKEVGPYISAGHRRLDDAGGWGWVFYFTGADFSRSPPLAASKGVGIIAMKPLAMGSIKYFDLHPRPGIKLNSMSLQEWVSRYNYSSGMPDNHGRLLVDVVARLVKNLGRMPDETLCMAAMRYCYLRPYISTVIRKCKPGAYDQGGGFLSGQI